MKRLATVLFVIVVLLYTASAVPWASCRCLGTANSIDAMAADCPDTAGHHGLGLTDNLNVAWSLLDDETAPPVFVATSGLWHPGLVIPNVDSDLRSPPPKLLVT